MARRGDYYSGVDPNALGRTMPATLNARPVGNPFLGAPVRSQGGSAYNPLLDPTGPFAKSTKLGALISGLGGGITRQEHLQQQANTLQAQAMQHVAEQAPKIGAQQAVLHLINSDLGQRLMISGGDFDGIAEVANLAAQGKVREARARAFGGNRSPVSQQPSMVTHGAV